jgi:probable phosphoglycerate mutase
MTTTRLILIRHGESQAQVERVVGGPTGCTGLSDLGRRQAAALHDRLAGNGLCADAVLTSVLPRAIETAAIVAPALGIDAGRIEEDCDLCEIHPGECDGIPWEEYETRYGVDMMADPDAPMSPGGESLRQFHTRVRDRIERVIESHRGQTVAIVSHGGVVVATTIALLGASGAPTERPFSLDVTNASLTEWFDDPATGRWTLERFNDAAHLEGFAP